MADGEDRPLGLVRYPFNDETRWHEPGWMKRAMHGVDSIKTSTRRRVNCIKCESEPNFDPSNGSI
jgi:hypothetical protein